MKNHLMLRRHGGFCFEGLQPETEHLLQLPEAAEAEGGSGLDGAS